MNAPATPPSRAGEPIPADRFRKRRRRVLASLLAAPSASLLRLSLVLSAALAGAPAASLAAEPSLPAVRADLADVEPLAAAERTDEPQTHALLLNGGGSATSNYLSHFHHLQDMVKALRSRGVPEERIHVFSADGEDPAKDMAVRGGEPADFWLIEGTDAGRVLLSTDLMDTGWEGIILHPARLRDLRQWFARMSETLRAGDTLLLFVTDHGSRNTDDPDNGYISLWNESLSVLEFRALLGYIQPGVRVVSVMSQCYSGAFAEAMTPLHSKVPAGNVCGFYSTTNDRPAYGCYPEGRDHDRIGHAFRFIDALGRHGSLSDVHAATLVTDTTPDVPMRTSDLFLERLLQAEATRRKLGLEELADEQLALAWKDRARWEPQIRLLDRIGQAYGTFSPRSMAELKPRIESLQSLSKELDTYEERWKSALDDLRRENLERFRKQEAAWQARMEPEKLQALDPPSRRSTLGELLPALKEFTAARADIRTRLQDLRETDEDASSAKYRTDVRLAALMRMRALLIRVAAVQLLSQAEASVPDKAPGPSRLVEGKRALEALEECEAFSVGSFDPRQETSPTLEGPEPLPPFEEDLAAVRRALPSWLGVQFRPVTDKQRERFEVTRGAAVIEQVYSDSPAGAAGLETGDVVLGPPEGHFNEPNQIREWTMTSPRDQPLALEVLRDGKTLRMTVSLKPYPSELPALPTPPKAGDMAPPLGSIRMVRSGAEGGVDLSSRRHMVLFWATWCGPCKKSLPELMAWSQQTGVPVLAVSDEDEGTLRKFLDSWKGPFPELVASDELRKGNLNYGVSGTPTFVLLDEHGKIEWRHVGYSAKNGLDIPGWSWSGRGE